MKEWVGNRREFLTLVALVFARSAPAMINLGVTAEAVSQIEALPPIKKEIRGPGSMLFGGWHPDIFAPNFQELLSLCSIVTTFPAWDMDSWRTDMVKQSLNTNKLPMISVGPSYQKFFEYSDRNICDFFIYKLRELSDDIFLFRPYYEFNGDWMGYGSKINSPAEFCHTWKVMCKTVRRICPGAILVWSPNVRYPITPYFPGDDFFDLIGLDGYNKSETVKINDRIFQPNLDFDQLFGPDLHLVSQMSKKPVIISEIGISASHPNALGWITHSLQKAPDYRVTAVCSFWETKFGFGEADWNWPGLQNGINSLKQVFSEHKEYISSTTNPADLRNVLYNKGRV